MAPPIYVKGGVWTNVEDQILRAAVSKYGLTQWARVASLLPKKTAKQAKARWNEYLNPTINRSEWSQQDDQKLLNLSKLLPNQWRSIASIMGRTATHCVERYQKLLDDALKGEDGDKADEDEDDLKLAGPGIETLPALGTSFESRPSRPDMDDMDEDEREMLSEAKARLANTQGKKAKRKDRERMLEESKRIALLLKRRELKSAGINVSLVLKNKKRRKEFDYNADIPHEHQPPPGLYDTSEESHLNKRAHEQFQKQVSAKGVPPVEQNKNKRDSQESAQKEATRVRKEILSAARTSADLQEYQEAKRRKLDLPAPGDERDEVDIGHQILEKSRELLAGQDETSAFAHGIKLQPPAAVAQISQDKKAPSKRPGTRKLAKLVSSLFSQLPTPKHNSVAIVPRLDVPDEKDDASLSITVLTSDSENLRVLRQVDLENEKARRSQVVQRGYKIPNPELLLPLQGNYSELEEAIAEQCSVLIKSDYAEFEDSSYMAKILPVLDGEIFATVKAAIDSEASEAKGLHPAISGVSTILKSREATDAALTLLEELNSAANTFDAEVTNRQSYIELESRTSELIQQINVCSEELSECDIREKLLSRVAQWEEIGEKVRSARLHDLTEDLRAAEARVHRRT